MRRIGRRLPAFQAVWELPKAYLTEGVNPLNLRRGWDFGKVTSNLLLATKVQAQNQWRLWGGQTFPGVSVSGSFDPRASRKHLFFSNRNADSDQVIRLIGP